MHARTFFQTITLAAICSLLLTCALPPQQKNAVQPEPGALAWPKPPAQTRIRYLQSISRPEDLGIEPSWWQNLINFFTGDDTRLELVRPSDVAVSGNLLGIADPGAQAMWILEPDAGRFQRIHHAANEQALVSPIAVAFSDSDNRIYLADSYRAEIIVYDKQGQYLATFTHAHMERPAGLAYDKHLNQLYVSDSALHHIAVFDREGKLLRTLGRRGIRHGEFNFPTHLSFDRDGILYVTDALGFRIQMFSRGGVFVKSFGHHGNGSGDFAAPKGVAVDSDGHIYVVDALFDTVQIFDRNGRYLLNFGVRGPAAGEFWLPNGLFVDPRDRIYIADAYNRRIQIFQYIVGDQERG